MGKNMRFWVGYNGEYLASFKTVRGCLGFIRRKNLVNDYRNYLCIVDSDGNGYNLVTGEKLKY